MKHFFITLLAAFFVNTLLAQAHFETLVERPNEKTLKGILDRQSLKADSTFTWFTENYKAYSAHKEGLATFQLYKDSIQLMVFMGTWCEDSHFIIPRLYAMIDAAGFPDNRITLIGVDRQKKSWAAITEALAVKNVPTIIVYYQGKELGRVIEYGRYGQFDREIGEILRTAFQK